MRSTLATKVQVLGWDTGKLLSWIKLEGEYVVEANDCKQTDKATVRLSNCVGILGSVSARAGDDATGAALPDSRQVSSLRRVLITNKRNRISPGQRHWGGS
jgi:hypothetical protein